MSLPLEARGFARGERGFYLRLDPRAGLLLLWVLRGGLVLGECLGSIGRANTVAETAPRTPWGPDRLVRGERCATTGASSGR